MTTYICLFGVLLADGAVGGFCNGSSSDNPCNDNNAVCSENDICECIANYTVINDVCKHGRQTNTFHVINYKLFYILNAPRLTIKTHFTKHSSFPMIRIPFTTDNVCQCTRYSFTLVLKYVWNFRFNAYRKVLILSMCIFQTDTMSC